MQGSAVYFSFNYTLGQFVASLFEVRPISFTTALCFHSHNIGTVQKRVQKRILQGSDIYFSFNYSLGQFAASLIEVRPISFTAALCFHIHNIGQYWKECRNLSYKVLIFIFHLTIFRLIYGFALWSTSNLIHYSIVLHCHNVGTEPTRGQKGIIKGFIFILQLITFFYQSVTAVFVISVQSLSPLYYTSIFTTLEQFIAIILKQNQQESRKVSLRVSFVFFS